MPTETTPCIEINQCLFGYKDGHKLLATSQEIPNETVSLLLAYSDIAPGLKPSQFESYWTGVPLPQLKSYALMHTWPAPELPRPGCVWTHIIFINFADMSIITNFIELHSLFKRPIDKTDYKNYSNKISVCFKDFKAKPLGINTEASHLLSIIKSLYSHKSTGIISASEYSDEALFSVWSQQWPRLRRSFSFRTAKLPITFLQTSPKFDLRVADRLSETTKNNDNIENWEQVILDDIAGHSSEFRSFLWRYGQDMHRGRERFKFLANTFSTTRCSYLSTNTLFFILDEIAKIMPDKNDGKLLKDDLISCSRDNNLFLPPCNPFDILDYFLLNKDREALPAPQMTTFETIFGNWPTGSAKLFSMIEKSTLANQSFSDAIFNYLATTINSETFFEITSDFPITRKRLIKEKPTFLGSPGLLHISQPELNSLLAYIPKNIDVALPIIKQLLRINDNLAAKFLIKHTPDILEQAIAETLIQNIPWQDRPVKQAWITVVHDRIPDLFAKKIYNCIDTSSSLFSFITALQFDIPLGLKISMKMWSKLLSSIKDDITGDNRQKLLTYMLSLALAMPQKGCEIIFEKTFEEIHFNLQHSLMSEEIFTLLSQYLPDLFWWRQWDKCLRLRSAIVRAYIKSDLDPMSFKHLTNDQTLLKELIELAEETTLGRGFIRKMFRSYGFKKYSDKN